MDGGDPTKTHLVLVPLMEQGHMIPMADLALLLATRGARVSFITTPVNARRLRATADRAVEAGLPLRLVELPFPCAEAGLPQGCENVDLVPSLDLFHSFFHCLYLLAGPLKQFLLQNVEPRNSPTCIIADQCLPWTATVAAELSIPRLIFHGPSCFFLLCTLLVTRHKLHEKVADEDEIFAVPELSQTIQVNKRQSLRFFQWPGFEDFLCQIETADDTADGFVLNTFYEMEPWCIDDYRSAVGKEVWPIGPVSLCHKDANSKAVRGNGDAAVDHGGVIEWLDAREPRSVLFVSFGSVASTSPQQLMEIGAALEATGWPFVWAVKTAEQSSEVEEWATEFKQRNQGRGMVMKGWVQQLLILSHPALGGFMTHCGWNSTLEAVAAGVPMVTWPHFADQFLNEKLVVEVLRTGVAVRVKPPEVYQAGELVEREVVERAMERVMGGGEEGEEMRVRARELGEKAMKAVEEGGSSYDSLGKLISRASELSRISAWEPGFS
ncbi:UDP-glycosyltransferase 73C1 [Apostasia shenzhenica]|uniref:Glycosyltransferase n=1 Tax=Apostasia shenzhenica TaxID=1088818 RepID=A0A2I0B6L4_9ASPA|nr:UDP-glycosyltransferase 73C1 [Apostasia shenzhenica]